MRNHFILFLSLAVSFSSLYSQSAYTNSFSASGTTSSSSSETRLDFIKPLTFAGFDFAIPQNLRHGFEAQGGYFSGPSFDFWGMGHFSMLTGYFTKTDTSGVQRVRGQRFSGVMMIPFPVFKSHHLNIVPYVGIGVFSSKGSDPKIESSGDGGVFGFSLTPGVNTVIGPLKIGISYSLEGGYAQKGSIFKGLNAIPTLSIGLSTQSLIFNPTIFSHTGMRQWTENYRTTSRTESKIDITGHRYSETTTTSSWDVMRGEQTSKQIKDIQPFFFIGPRIQTNFMHINTEAFVPTMGLMSGFRSGTFYMSAMIDRGSFYVKEPFKRDESTTIYDYRERLDGYMENSYRVGGEIGLDLVTYFIKKGFESKSSFLNKTSFYAIIPRVGYYNQHNGNLVFYSDSASVAMDNYLAANGSVNDIRLAPKNINCLGLGGTVTFGAIAFNYDFYAYKKYKTLNHYEFSFSYHLPIIRVFKAVNVFFKANKLKRQQN